MGRKPYMVMISFVYVLIICSILVSVQAGHGLWEHNAISAGHSRSSSLEKRWYTIVPSDTGNVLWPNGGEISYFFESDATKAKVFADLEAALNRWYQMGLPETQFRMTEVTKANFQANRGKVLLIKHNDRGILSTSLGIPAKDATQEEQPDATSDQGPTMNLSDRTDVGMLETIANYAHELGHAWGLIHEHQNPAFWTTPYSSGGLVNEFRFNCQNLKDFQDANGKLTDPIERTQLCQVQRFASEQKFSASEFLPIPLGRGPTGFEMDVDWNSIMLYPSGVGGLGDAQPGNDQRADVLLKSDGSKIPINLHPSEHDVVGLKDLYKDVASTAPPVLLNEPANSKRSKFKRLFKRQGCK